MENVLAGVRFCNRLLGDNLVGAIFALAAGAVVIIASPTHAGGGATCAMMIEEAELEVGESIPCSMQVLEENSGICPSPIVTQTGKEICPIRTPGQVIEEALQEQLSKEAP
jgi:hypothetical protein